MAKSKAASRVSNPVDEEDPTISQRQWDIAKSSIFASQLRAGGGANWDQLLATPGFGLGLTLEGFLQGLQHSRDESPEVLGHLEVKAREACTLAHQFIVTMRSINPALPQPPVIAAGMDASPTLLAYLGWCVDAGQVQPILPIPEWASTSLSRLHRQIRTLRESRPLSTRTRNGRLNAPAELVPLGDHAAATFKILCALPDTEGRTAKQLVSELGRQQISTNESRVRKLVNLELKPRGVEWARRCGYFVPKAARPG